MAKPSSNIKGLAGPNRLLIGASKLQYLAPGTVQNVKPAYLPAGIPLPGARARAENIRIQFGGVLDELPVQERIVFDGSTTLALAFDINSDNVIDSFFLSDFTLRIPSINAAGLVIEDAVIQLRDLSNHPTLLTSQGVAAGSWLGLISITGATLGLSAIPEFRINPLNERENAFSASYNIATGDITARLSAASYSSPRISVDLRDSELLLSNATKDITLSGSGLLSLLGLGLTNLEGSLDVQLADAELQRIQASITAARPIGPLGISGSISFDHDVKAGSGSIGMTNATLAGMEVSGMLQYANSSNPAKDLITGQLLFDNSIARNSLDVVWPGLTSFPLALIPISGKIDYLYRPAGSETSGSLLDFNDVRFDVKVGATVAPFQGSLELNLDPISGVSIQSMSLHLLSRTTLASDVFGSLTIAPEPSGAPASFSLKRINKEDGTLSGLMPLFSGELLYSYPGTGFGFRSAGLSYEPVADSGEPPAYAWTITNPQLWLG